MHMKKINYRLDALIHSMFKDVISESVETYFVLLFILETKYTFKKHIEVF